MATVHLIVFNAEKCESPALHSTLHKDGHVFGEWAELHCGLDTLRTDSVPTALTSVCGSCIQY